MKKLLLFYVLVLAITFSFSAIKGPNYHGIRTMGMGNTTVAVTTNRTAIFHNPAGLGLLKNKMEVSITPFVAAIDGKFFSLLGKMLDQSDALGDLENITPEVIDLFSEFDGEWVGFELLPEVTVATENLGFGIYSVWPVEFMVESGHFIPKLALRGQRDLVFTWAVGLPLKSDHNHFGISVEYLQRTSLSDRITSYSETFILFDKMNDGLFSSLGFIGEFSKIEHGVSFDVGAIHDIGGFRIAYDVKDLLGVIGGKLVFPPQFDFGLAYSFPQVKNIETIDNIIFAIEMSDVLGLEPASEEYMHPTKKLHVGFEFDLHYAALRLGINQGYPTAGFGLRLGPVAMDYVFYQEELGYYPGQLPIKKHVFSLGINFQTERLKRKSDARSTSADDIYEEPQKQDVKKIEPGQKSEPLDNSTNQTVEPVEDVTPQKNIGDESIQTYTEPIEESLEESVEETQIQPDEAMESVEPASQQVEEVAPQEQKTTEEESVGWE